MKHEIEVHKYEKCLDEIKRRIEVIKNYLGGKNSTGFLITEVEFLALQFRKVIELIAFSTLVANKDEYSKVRSSIEREWQAKRIFDVLEKINPHFYPEPSKQVERKNISGPQFVELQPLKHGFLTRDEPVKVYDECSDVLHAWNPFGKEKDIKTLYTKFMEWTNKLITLLSHHSIILVEKRLLICAEMQSRVNGNPKAFVFGKMSDSDVKDFKDIISAEIHALLGRKKLS